MHVRNQKSLTANFWMVKRDCGGWWHWGREDRDLQRETRETSK